MPSDPSPAQKVVHRFQLDDDSPNPPKEYAFVHGLGTTDVFVTVRSSDGSAHRGNVRTTVQDDNIVVVSKADGYSFRNGDSIIVMG